MQCADSCFSDYDDTGTALSSNWELAHPRNRGMALQWQQFKAILLQRRIYTTRHSILFLSQFFIPLLLSVVGLVFFRQLTNLSQKNQPSLETSLHHYGSGITVPFGIDLNIIPIGDDVLSFAKSYIHQFDDQLVKSKYVGSPIDFQDTLLSNVAAKQVRDYLTKYLIGLNIFFNSSEDFVQAYFQGESYHTPPISLNAVTNAHLRWFTRYHKDQCPGLANSTVPPKVHTFNHPLPYNQWERSETIVTRTQIFHMLFAGYQLSTILILAFSYLSSTCFMSIIHDYVTKAKHLHVVSGVKLLPYWLANYVWDMSVLVLCSSLVTVVFAAFNVDAYSIHGSLKYLFYLLLAYSWAILPQMYLLARLFKAPTSGLVWGTMLNSFSAFVGATLVVFLASPIVNHEEAGYTLSSFFKLLSPSYSLINGIFVIFQTYNFRATCDQPIVVITCESTNSTNPCCTKTCDPFCAYWTADYLSFERGGIGWNICSFIVQGIILNLLVLVVDSHRCRSFCHLCRGWFSGMVGICCQFRSLLRDVCRSRMRNVSNVSSSGSFDGSDLVREDEDVDEHRHLIESITLGRLRAEASLVLRRVCKTYDSRAITARFDPSSMRMAVNEMSLGVFPSECFGLLGVNGAGKTTLFRMITGDLNLTSGQILVNGYDVELESGMAQQSLGYCPQYDALLLYLTGRETLQLYARFRGLNESVLNAEIDKLLFDLHLIHDSNVLVKHYSGGKRRRLSIAVALIGGMPLICLDEPTAGVDPISRRRIWNILIQHRLQGRTLFLSSHSMDECEVLCSKVGIVLNGQLKCLGTCQHLKARFGRGYSLILQIAPPVELTWHSSMDDPISIDVNSENVLLPNRRTDQSTQSALNEMVMEAMNFVTESIPDAHLVERLQGVLQYHLPTTSDSNSLSKIFALMEENKQRLNLATYSLSQTTLEQIFIDLARFQNRRTTFDNDQ